MNSSITLDWLLSLLPEFFLVVWIAIVLIYDRGLQPANRRNVGLVTAWGAFVALLLAIAAWVFFNQTNSTGQNIFWGGMIRYDLIAFVFQIMFLSALLITSLIAVDTPRLQRGEFFALLIAATIGFSLMSASVDLIMIYVALELASISSYLLAGYAPGR